MKLTRMMSLKKTKTALSDFYHSVMLGWNYLSETKVERYSIALSFIFFLSILDAIFTLLWIDTGLAVEANPLLSGLVESGSFPFIATKVFLTLLGCGILFKIKDESLHARRAIVGLLFLYVMITLYHFFGALVSVDSSHVSDFVSDFLVWLS